MDKILDFKHRQLTTSIRITQISIKDRRSLTLQANSHKSFTVNCEITSFDTDDSFVCFFVFSHHWKHFWTWPSFDNLPKLPSIDNYTHWIWTFDQDPLDGWIDVLALLALFLLALLDGRLQGCQTLVRIIFLMLLKSSYNNLFYRCPHCGAYLGTYRGSWAWFVILFILIKKSLMSQ